MPDKTHIEELFRDRFSEFKVEPSGGTWTGISRKLAIREFFHFSFTSFNVWYAAVGIGLIGGLVYVGLEVSEPDIAEPVDWEVTEEVLPFEEPGVFEDTAVLEPEPEVMDTPVYDVPDDSHVREIDAMAPEPDQVKEQEVAVLPTDTFIEPMIVDPDSGDKFVEPVAEVKAGDLCCCSGG